MVLVDLDAMTVVDVEDHGVVPLPERAGNYSAEALTEPGNKPSFPRGPRQDVRPLDIVQADGPSFTLDGHHLRWQKWDLRIGFTAREGLVLHRIGYDDGGGLRSVIHRASLSEMFVPYGDPAATHYRKLVLDEGEYGIGLLTNSLELGCDCLGEIRYLDGVVNDNEGKAMVVPNAICLHEEDCGIAWKHTDFRTGYAEVRRMRRMVISSIVTVGNYEYGYFWYLYQDGSLEYQVKLTGVISTGAVPPGEVPAHGTLVAPGMYGPHHQHFFNVRLDMAVDRRSSSKPCRSRSSESCAWPSTRTTAASSTTLSSPWPGSSRAAWWSGWCWPSSPSSGSRAPARWGRRPGTRRAAYPMRSCGAAARSACST